MTAVAVARDDLLNAVRSRVALGVVAAFVGTVGLLFLAESGIHPHPYRTLYDVVRAYILVAPILLAPLAYAAVAGDRASGRIRFVLGLPRTRGSYVAGLVLSRTVVAVGATLCSVLVGFLVALATFQHSPDPVRFAVFSGVSSLYALSFVSLFVAVSAVARNRSTAMLGAVGAYFVLVPFWIGMLPPVGLDTALTAVGDLLGTTVPESTRQLVRSLSPYGAYGRASEPVFAGAADRYELLHDSPDTELSQYLWFNVAVLLAWSVGSAGLALAQFRRTDLV
ncbi:ABC transporter permease [Halosimplex aquaticum]|uniref:ABC transporter permease n=1 Tax=Halosimplex aquaticum TaxID=3026162 RepID=A0ABD5Y532_9EURY|nr:ABC transporter permease subunit [Halosimplex aquaticum]